MFGKLKTYCQKKFKRFRIFSRIRAYREELLMIKDKSMSDRRKIKSLQDELLNAVSEINSNHEIYVKNISVIKNKHERASKKVGDCMKRRNEFLKRIQGKIPDDVISGRFNTYKVWLMEPFMEETYDPYKGVDDRIPFIDGLSATEGLMGVLDDAAKKEKEAD